MTPEWLDWVRNHAHGDTFQGLVAEIDRLTRELADAQTVGRIATSRLNEVKADIDRLRRELADTKEHLENPQRCLSQIHRITDLEAENARLREALEQYADPINWSCFLAGNGELRVWRAPHGPSIAKSVLQSAKEKRHHDQ